MESSSWRFSDLSSKFIIPAIAIISYTILRSLYLVHQNGKPLRPRAWKQPLRTLIVLGSGKHTESMLNLLSAPERDKFSPKFYVAAATDNLSLIRARTLEASFAELSGSKEISAEFMQISTYSNRKLGHSFIAHVWNILVALARAFWLMIKIKPQVIICNGSVTCIPICLAAFQCKVLGFSCPTVYYIESIASVNRLSLCGSILYRQRVVDHFYVQRPELQRQYPQALYVGVVQLIDFCC